MSTVWDLAAETGAGLSHDRFEHANRALELGDQGGGLARRPSAGTAERSAGVVGHDQGLFDAGLGDGGQFAGQDQHLVLGITAASSQPHGDLMGAAAN